MINVPLLYIDPGTGSLFFGILFSIIGSALYFGRLVFMKIRYGLNSKKATNKNKLPLVIFSDDKRYYNVFEPICKELESRGIKTLYLTMSADDPVFQASYTNIKAECIGKGNAAFARLNALNAAVVLSTTPGLNVYQWKRSRLVDCYVHIPHAVTELTMYRAFGIDYYDAVLCANKHQIEDVRKLETLRNLPAKELLLVGTPYMDVMASGVKREPVKQKTILLAPSWGNSAIFGVYDRRIIEALVKTGYHIVIRPHPQSFISEKEMIDKLMTEFPESEQIEWNRDTNNADVLSRSSLLISDFSGIVYEFALVYEKPVMYADPKINKDVYDAWWLNEPSWTEDILTKIGCPIPSDLTELKDKIDLCLNGNGITENIQETKEELWVNSGDSTRLVVDYIQNKLTALQAEETTEESDDIS